MRSYTLLPPVNLPASSLPRLPPSGYEFNYEAIMRHFGSRHITRAVKWLVQESQLFGSWVGFQPRIYWELFSVTYWREHDPELAHNCGFAATMTGFRMLQEKGYVRITHEEPNATTTVWPTNTFVDLSRMG